MIESETISISEFFHSGQFEPAKIQRQYSWTRQQARELIEDLQEARENRRISSHYLGPYILLKSTRRKRFATVYDGFHRIVTTSVLLTVISNLMDEKNEENITSALRHDGHPRIVYPTPGRTLTDFLAGRKLTKGPLSNADVNLRSVIAEITNNLKGQTKRELYSLSDFILNKTLVTITVLDSRREAFRAFVTANDRGMRLNQGDLLKGYLVDLIETHKKQGGGQNFARAWTTVQRSLDRSFEDFLKTIHFLLFQETADLGFVDHWLERFESDTKVDRLVEIVEVRFTQLAGHFAKIDATSRKTHVDGEEMHLFRLSLLPWKEWQAVALLLMHYDEWPGALQRLAQACWIIELLQISNERRAHIMNEACRQIESRRNPFENIGHRETNPQFFGELTFNIHNQRVAQEELLGDIRQSSRMKAITRWMETVISEHSTGGCNPSLILSLSLEHVVPRHPRADWKDWSEQQQRNSIYKLGNTCLIPHQMNTQLENYAATKKFKAFMSLGPEYKSATDVVSYNTWSPETVSERTNRLCELACTLGLGILAEDRKR